MKRNNFDDVKLQLCRYDILSADTDETIFMLYHIALDLNLVSLGDCLTIRDIIVKGKLDQNCYDTHRLLLVMFAAVNYGSLCVRLEEPQMRETVYITPLLGSVDETEYLINQIKNGAYASIVAADEQDLKPLVLAEGFLYFQRYFYHETSLKKRLLCFLEDDHCMSPVVASERCEMVKTCSSYASYTLNKEQQAAVYLALRKNVLIISGGPGTGKTTIVTSLLRALYKTGTVLSRVRLLAPTGRAGQRIGESIQEAVKQIGNEDAGLLEELKTLSGSTIHALLRYNPSTNSFTYNDKYQLPADVVIVDEVSMIDVALMDAMLAALKPGTKIIFLGDKNQLPSVGAGAVLGDLVPLHDKTEYSDDMIVELKNLNPDMQFNPAMTAKSLTNHVVLLTETHRSKGAILQTAVEINNGNDAFVDYVPAMCDDITFKVVTPSDEAREMLLLDVDWLHPDRMDRCFWLPDRAKGRVLLQEILLSWSSCFLARRNKHDDSYQELVTNTLFDEHELNYGLAEATILRLQLIFDKMQNSRILSLVRNGAYGCNGINYFLATSWRHSFDPESNAGSVVFAGAPIMITKNNRSKNLYNGDTGIIVKSNENHYFAIFKRGEFFITLPVHLLPEYELAFAITVHKSQGSEYKNVLIVLPDDHDHALLSREILYTGITRAKRMAVITGNKKVFKKAVQTKIIRQSGMMWY